MPRHPLRTSALLCLLLLAACAADRRLVMTDLRADEAGLSRLRAGSAAIGCSEVPPQASGFVLIEQCGDGTVYFGQLQGSVDALCKKRSVEECRTLVDRIANAAPPEGPPAP